MSLQISNFQTTAYGTRSEFRRAEEAAAFYDAISRSIVIPCFPTRSFSDHDSGWITSRVEWMLERSS